MKYSWKGVVVSSAPDSTRPGWVRQVNGVGAGISVGGEGVNVFVGSGRGVKVGGFAVSVGKGWLDDAQADGPARSVSRIIVSIVA